MTVITPHEVEGPLRYDSHNNVVVFNSGPCWAFVYDDFIYVNAKVFKFPWKLFKKHISKHERNHNKLNEIGIPVDRHHDIFKALGLQ